MSNVYEIVTEKIIKQLEDWCCTCGASLGVLNCQSISFRRKSIAASMSFCWAHKATVRNIGSLTIRPRSLAATSSAVKSLPLSRFGTSAKRRTIRRSDGTERLSKPILLRYYSVFNLEQTEGIAEKLGLSSVARVADIEACERIVCRNAEPPQREQSDRAWYRPSTDTVGMPAKSSFLGSEEYYSTLFHELTHSTGHKSRVGRDGIEHLNTFGSESYSQRGTDC